MELVKIENNFDITLEVIFEQFQSSMNALAFQDYHSSEKSFVIARNAYLGLKDEKGGENDLKFIGSFVSLIEVTTQTIKSTFLAMEGRFEKALTLIKKSLEISHNSRSTLNELVKINYEMRGFEDVFSFYFAYFEILLTGSKNSLQGSIDKENGKFVDLIALNQKIIQEYRKINDFAIDINSNSAKLMYGLSGTLNKLADTMELQTENLIEKNKTISFLPPINNGIFLIHGHGLNYVREFKELMQTQFELKPIILIDEPNKGKTLIEKVEDFGMHCAFAFAILTPDDWVQNNENQYFQARPNVLFELGWFIGRYGREKVRIIKKKGTELPSDLSGLVTIDFNNSIEEVFLKIKKELHDLGLLNT